jgi:hypothetical protein
MKRHQYFLWLTIVVILVAMATCGPREIELPFATIERSDLGDYSIREPRLILVTAPQEIDQLEGLIAQEALDRLAELDFEQYFAVVVFRGTQATSGYDTIIERIARRGDKIVAYVQFWEPSPHYAVLDEATSPYHLVRVRRDGSALRETELVLRSRTVTPTPPSR